MEINSNNKSVGFGYNCNQNNAKKRKRRRNRSDFSHSSDTKVTNNRQTKRKTFKSEIWFDGVDPCLVKASKADHNAGHTSATTQQQLVKEKAFTGLTKVVAMDCEMVGTGSDGSASMLARVSVVNFFGHCLYDKYVKPTEEVTDYRTEVSGITSLHVRNGVDFKVVQKEVNDILDGRILVGHAIKNDLKVLFLSHPKNKIRDTSSYFRRLFGGRTPALKKLAQTVLGVSIQSGEHDSVEDARVAMRLFTMFRRKWETDINRHTTKRQAKKKHK